MEMDFVTERIMKKILPLKRSRLQPAGQVMEVIPLCYHSDSARLISRLLNVEKRFRYVRHGKQNVTVTMVTAVAY
jgi:hypothetical protein